MIAEKVLPVLATPEVAYAAFAVIAVDESDEVPDEEEAEKYAAAGAGQFSERTSGRYKTFKDATLKEQPSKIFAEILYSTWTGAVAEELKLRATEDLSTQQPVPWLKYLQADGKEEKTLLQTLWLDYQQSVMSRPAPIATDVSAVGDEVADNTADERSKLAIALHELRRKNINFID